MFIISEKTMQQKNIEDIDVDVDFLLAGVLQHYGCDYRSYTRQSMCGGLEILLPTIIFFIQLYNHINRIPRIR